MDKSLAIKVRDEFFDQVIDLLNMPPRSMDALLLQAQYYVPIKVEDIIKDSELGDFFVPINPSFQGRSWTMGYSVWQFGTELRIALMTQSQKEEECFLSIINSENKTSLDELWDNAIEHSLYKRENFYFYEWRFNATEFLSSYAVRETFALGIRHMHFRVLRVLKKLSDDLRESAKKK